MKKIKIIVLCAALFLAAGRMSWASEMDVLVGKLVEKGILTPYEAQILQAEAKESAAKELAKGESVTAPSWTQNIKMKGDVRFRVQPEWGKGLSPAHQRIRERVRARVGLDGKVNEQISAGVLAVTGSNDPRSTNQTLDDGFATEDLRLDNYYIKWDPQFNEKYGDGTLWFGKFNNPFVTTSLLWDSDICPEGIAAQYLSPTFNIGDRQINTYGNFGFLFLDELSRFQTDPLMFVYQAGVTGDISQENGSTFNIAGAFYDVSHIKGNHDGVNFTGNSGTNARYGAGRAYAYDYNIVDLLMEYDSKRLFAWDIGNGLYSDLIYNMGAPEQNFAWEAGAYLGAKKPKDPGQWKLYGAYRYLAQEAVPDFMPDSDFTGFNTLGAPAGGGTNGQGFIAGFDYALFKNTTLNVKYYYTVPIDMSLYGQSSDTDYQLLQFDINTKF